MFDIWSGIDFSKDKLGDESAGGEYVRMNLGSGKYHPGGPSCTYKGKPVPYLVKFSEGGGIAGHILTNLLVEMIGTLRIARKFEGAFRRQTAL